jgi:hypothetical protein
MKQLKTKSSMRAEEATRVMCSLYSFFLIVSIFLHSYESLCMCLFMCFTKIKTKGLYSKWNSMKMHIKVLILSSMFNWSY